MVYLARIFMYANAAVNAKIKANVATETIQYGENVGTPMRNERIMSEALLSGLTSAKVTSIDGN